MVGTSLKFWSLGWGTSFTFNTQPLGLHQKISPRPPGARGGGWQTPKLNTTLLSTAKRILHSVSLKIICPSQFFNIIVIKGLQFLIQKVVFIETAVSTCFSPPVSTLFCDVTSVQRLRTANWLFKLPFFRFRQT